MLSSHSHAGSFGSRAPPPGEVDEDEELAVILGKKSEAARCFGCGAVSRLAWKADGPEAGAPSLPDAWVMPPPPLGRFEVNLEQEVRISIAKIPNKKGFWMMIEFYQCNTTTKIKFQRFQPVAKGLSLSLFSTHTSFIALLLTQSSRWTTHRAANHLTRAASSQNHVKHHKSGRKRQLALKVPPFSSTCDLKRATDGSCPQSFAPTIWSGQHGEQQPFKEKFCVIRVQVS